MSAFGHKRTFSHTLKYVRFTPECGHSEGSCGMSAYDPKRTMGKGTENKMIQRLNYQN